MEKENNFYQHLFVGMNSFLENEPINCVDRFLAYCAKHCSESYSKQVFLDNIRINEPIEHSLDRLNGVFKNSSYKIDSDKIIMLLSTCGCDLVNDHFIQSSKLCICSEKSILLNWESVYGKDNVTVKRVKSILAGNDTCEFEVRIKQLGHLL